MRLALALVLLLAVAAFGLLLKRKSGWRLDRARAQVPVPISGMGEENPPPGLQFLIRAVHRGVHPIPNAPFFEAGGDWLFFEAVVESSPEARFTVGVAHGAPRKGIAWGKALIAVESASVGGAFVQAFAEGFGVELPEARPGGPLQPLELSTAVLGEQLKPGEAGGFSEGGTWTATKWFPSIEGREAEVYFNYDLQKLQGEFSEKDEEYAEDLVAVLTMALRDGRPPPRTPANDPSLSEVGPTLLRLRQVGSPRARVLGPSPDGEAFLLTEPDPSGGEEIYGVALEAKAPVLWAQLQGYVDQVQFPAPPAMGLVIREALSQEKGVHSSEDPARLWWVASPGATPERVDWPEFGPQPRLATSALSPDGRFVAVQAWQDTRRGQPRLQRTFLYDRIRHAVAEAKGNSKNLEVQGWERAGASWRARVASGFDWDPPASREHALVDPVSGALEPFASRPTDRKLSADGSRRWALEDGALVITDVDTGAKRSLRLHPDDAAAVSAASEFDPILRWVSPRYLALFSAPLVFFDTANPRASLPLHRDETPPVEFNRAFTAALLSEDEGLFIARVKLPGD